MYDNFPTKSTSQVSDQPGLVSVTDYFFPFVKLGTIEVFSYTETINFKLHWKFYIAKKKKKKKRDGAYAHYIIVSKI